MNLHRVLFVGAHTDDVELFAGGLLAKVCDEGEAHVIAYSPHKGVRTKEVSQQAAKEWWQNISDLGCGGSIYSLGACNGDFEQDRDLIYKTVEGVWEDFRPTVVVTHHPEDTNQDHRQVAMEVVRCLKGRCSILAGEYPFNRVWGGEPNVFIPLRRPHIERKVNLILRYRSQMEAHRYYFDREVWEGLARLRGAQIGHPYAEAFGLIRGIYHG